MWNFVVSRNRAANKSQKKSAGLDVKTPERGWGGGWFGVVVFVGVFGWGLVFGVVWVGFGGVFGCGGVFLCVFLFLFFFC